jgi:exodeoxyribonuclease VII small subunit
MTTTKTKTTAAGAASASGLTFGEAMERLESIVGQLEGDQSLELEHALAIYEQGVALAAECRQRLATAELRLTEIAAQAPLDEPVGPN